MSNNPMSYMAIHFVVFCFCSFAVNESLLRPVDRPLSPSSFPPFGLRKPIGKVGSFVCAFS